MGVLGRINSSINSYLTIKTAMSLLTGFVSYIILVIIGVDFPILWAFLIFLFNFIPYIGSMIATLLPSLFAIFQFGSIWTAVLVLIQTVQFAVGSLIEPRFMGKTLNLSPLVVILALSFWGSIWGVLGMLLSVPITSVIIIILGQIPETRSLAVFMSETGEIRSGDKD